MRYSKIYREWGAQVRRFYVCVPSLPVRRRYTIDRAAEVKKFTLIDNSRIVDRVMFSVHKPPVVENICRSDVIAVLIETFFPLRR